MPHASQVCVVVVGSMLCSHVAAQTSIGPLPFRFAGEFTERFVSINSTASAEHVGDDDNGFGPGGFVREDDGGVQSVSAYDDPSVGGKDLFEDVVVDVDGRLSSAEADSGLGIYLRVNGSRQDAILIYFNFQDGGESRIRIINQADPTPGDGSAGGVTLVSLQEETTLSAGLWFHLRAEVVNEPGGTIRVVAQAFRSQQQFDESTLAIEATSVLTPSQSVGLTAPGELAIRTFNGFFSNTVSDFDNFAVYPAGQAPSAIMEPCSSDIADDFGTPGPDGYVSFGDFLALLGLIGPCPGGTPGCAGDIADDFGNLGGDGMVSFGDFLALLGLIGPCP